MDLSDVEKKLADLPNQVIDQVLLVRVGTKGVAIIRKRTESGQFLPGSSPNAEKYSTTPMPLPYSVISRKFGKGKAKEAGYKIFTSKKGNVWIVLPGGYRQYRQLYGKAVDHVSLSWTGRMLRNLKVLSSEGNAAELGFDDAEEARIASYHNILGAGKSKKKHVFMGFTAEEEAQLGTDAAKVIGEKVRAYFGE